MHLNYDEPGPKMGVRARSLQGLSPEVTNSPLGYRLRLTSHSDGSTKEDALTRKLKLHPTSLCVGRR